MTKQRFAVFDIDGTLIRWQLYHAIVDRLASSDKLTPDAARIINNSKRGYDHREHPESFSQYEMTLVEIFNTAITGLKVDDFTTVIDSVFEEYKDRSYRYTRQLVKTLKDDGYKILAISGSPHEIIQQLGSHYGFDDVRGDKRLSEDGVFTGERVATIGAKAEILQELIDEHNLTLEGSVAVGDSEGDIAMLSFVENPIAFNPSKKLFDTAKENHWKVVIERKNMSYELNFVDGQYILDTKD